MAILKRIPQAPGLPLIIFSLCFTLGIFLGYGFAEKQLCETGDELRRYFDGYMLLAAREVSVAAVLRTMNCFFRAPFLAFFLGFSSIGIVLLPLLCVLEGSLFSFSVCCFAGTLGRDGFVLVLALFALRILFVLPSTLFLSVRAMEKSKALALLSVGGGKRVRSVSYGAGYWYSFGIVCVCLLIGVLLELWLIPEFLTFIAV